MPFKKGQSGNPGGRPRETREVRELARSYTAEAIKRLGLSQVPERRVLQQSSALPTTSEASQ